MLKVAQETLNLGLIRRIMLSVLVWAIGVIYHVDVYASWHIGVLGTKCTKNEDANYIFRSGINNDGDAKCCSVALNSTFYYAPVSLLNNMVRVYDTKKGQMSTLVAAAGGNAGKVVCMDANTRSDMISFFAQSCQKYYPNPDQPNVYETICESSTEVDPDFYDDTSIVIGQPTLTTENVHVPTGAEKWHNRRRFKCENADVSDFYGGAFTTGARYLTGYAYPVLLVNGGFSSAPENLYTGDCRTFPDEVYRLDPYTPCWNSLTSPYSPLAHPWSIMRDGCLEKCPEGYYCPQNVPLGDFFFNSTVSETGLYENGRRPDGGALPCEPGSYSSNPGSRSCNLCERGYYQDKAGQTSCSTCPSVSQYDTSGSLLGGITGTTSTTGAKSDTECFVNSSGNYLAGENGLFAFSGECYYS